jgi:flavin reductase (DIM6/NTAB) family NADH-FMN oxidoreductase RutF
MTDHAAFEAFAATVATPMHIVTAPGVGDRPGNGCLVGFSTQCSIDPTHYLVCLSKENETYLAAVGAPTLVVHILHDADHDRALARLFGERTGHDVDKFSRCEWDEGPDGVPVLRGLDHFEGHVRDQHDLGDHVGFALTVGAGRADRAREPLLTYQQVKDLDAGNDA